MNEFRLPSINVSYVDQKVYNFSTSAGISTSSSVVTIIVPDLLLACVSL